MKYAQLKLLMQRGFVLWCIWYRKQVFHYKPPEGLSYSRGTEEAGREVEVFEIRNTPEMPVTTYVRLWACVCVCDKPTLKRFLKTRRQPTAPRFSFSHRWQRAISSDTCAPVHASSVLFHNLLSVELQPVTQTQHRGAKRRIDVQRESLGEDVWQYLVWGVCSWHEQKLVAKVRDDWKGCLGS